MNFTKLLREAQFHGAVRLAEKKYSGYWALALLVLFGNALVLVYLTVVRFLNNPTFLVRHDDVQEMTPFPSVIMCPEVRIQDYKIDAFLKNLKYPPKMNSSIYRPIMRQIEAFYSKDALYKLVDLEKIEELLKYNNINVYDAGLQLSTSCQDTLIRCRWFGEIVNCSVLFMMDLTGDGYCCVFNGRSWHREMVYFGHIPKDPFPKWYSSTYGHMTGLMMAIKQERQKPSNVDLEYKWLALQSNQHFVEPSINGTPLNIGAEQWAAYHYHRFHIADEARSLSNSLRKCVLGDEPLKYYPNYHKKKNENTIYLILMAIVTHGYLPQQETLDAAECGCPQGCDVGHGHVEISSFDLVPNVPTYDSFYDGLNFSEITIVRAYIGRMEIKTKSRQSYFSAFDLFAQLGGVFNVFFGCSVLTVLELIQLIYRGVFNLYANGKNGNQRKIKRSKRDGKPSAWKMGKY